MIRLAIIGLGMASKPHLEALAALSDRVEVAGLLTRNQEKGRGAAANLGVRAFTSLDDITSDEAIDAALVLTPPNARAGIVTSLARAHKHILLEKPIERTLPAARELVETCEEAGIHLGLVLQHRFKPAARTLARMLASGTLGTPYLCRIIVPWWRDQAYYDMQGRGTFAQDGGGVLITQAIHVIDLALSLMPPLASLQAMLGTSQTHRMETEDFAAIGLIFEGGALGSLMATTAAFPGGAESIQIDTDRASCHLEAGSLAIHWRDGRIERYGEETQSGGGADPMAFSSAWHEALLVNFCDAIEGRAQLAVTGRDGLAVHRLLDAAMRSNARSGARIALREE